MNCLRCGAYEITGQMQWALMRNPLSERQCANASGWVRSQSGIVLTLADDPQLRALPTPTVAERGDYLLRQLAHEYPTAGKPLRPDLNRPDYLAIARCVNHDELYFITWEYLGREKGFLAPDPGTSEAYGNLTKLTPRAWAYLEASELNPSSDLGFVAMSFAAEIRPAYDGAIKPAVEDAGYGVVRADEHRHEGLIDAEIHALIRRSRFLVADFTSQNNGVYYEAGFARGLGLQVFRTCRDDDAARVHFDQNHYHVLRWSPTDLPALRRELQLRIEEVFGRGPRKR